MTTTRGSLAPVIRSLWTPVALSVILAAVVLVANALSDPGASERLTTALVYMIVVIGLYIFIGNSGVVSFGHVSFMAVGAYTYALMTIPAIRKSFLLPNLPSFIKHLELGNLPATILAGVIAAIFASIVGYPLMRLSGISASIAMFSLLIIVNTVISQATDYTRGEQTMVGIPQTTTVNYTLGWVIVAIFAAYGFQQTRYGLRLRCSREDEFGARSVGVAIPRVRVIALVPSAFFVGVGGALWAALLGILTPEGFYIEMTFTTIVMLVVGGMRSLTGAVVGATAVYVVSDILRRLEPGFHVAGLHVPARPGLQLLGVSILALLVLLLRPAGITGGREIPRLWLARPERKKA
jgi:branched-chain amino acid transport system permease protein